MPKIEFFKEGIFMDKEKIDRINYLAHKSKTPEGLTEEEKTEQATLRKEYLAEWRRGMTETLDNTYIVEPDGTKHKVKPLN